MSCVRACRPRTSRHVCVCKCCAPPSRLVRISGLALGHISFMLNKTKVAFGAKGAFPFRWRSRGDVCATWGRGRHVVLEGGYPVGATHGPSSRLRFPSTLIDHLLIFFWSTPASLSSSAWTVRTRGTLVRGSHVSTAPRQEGKKISRERLSGLTFAAVLLLFELGITVLQPGDRANRPFLIAACGGAAAAAAGCCFRG